MINNHLNFLNADKKIFFFASETGFKLLVFRFLLYSNKRKSDFFKWELAYSVFKIQYIFVKIGTSPL